MIFGRDGVFLELLIVLLEYDDIEKWNYRMYYEYVCLKVNILYIVIRIIMYKWFKIN